MDETPTPAFTHIARSLGLHNRLDGGVSRSPMDSACSQGLEGAVGGRGVAVGLPLGEAPRDPVSPDPTHHAVPVQQVRACTHIRQCTWSMAGGGPGGRRERRARSFVAPCMHACTQHPTRLARCNFAQEAHASRSQGSGRQSQQGGCCLLPCPPLKQYNP